MPSRKKKKTNNEQTPPDSSKKKQGKKPFKEPKIKWEKSKAKKLVEKDLREGRVPLTIPEGKSRYSMKYSEVYKMHTECSLYDPNKFETRLASLRAQVLRRNARALADERALEVQRKNYKPATYTYDGLIQWQGSDAQALLWDDMEKKKHRQMSKKDLWASRPEYYENFPLDNFRDKVYQEVRTAKYLYTLEVKGKQFKAS